MSSIVSLNNTNTDLDSVKKKIENNDSDISTIKSDITTINTTITDLKKSVSDGKSSLASAITSQGVTTSSDATFSVMSSNIKTACTNKYNSGYSNGVTDADNRVNTSSANYKSGYNNGYSAGKSSVSVSSSISFKYHLSPSSSYIAFKVPTNCTHMKITSSNYTWVETAGVVKRYPIFKGVEFSYARTAEFTVTPGETIAEQNSPYTSNTWVPLIIDFQVEFS